MAFNNTKRGPNFSYKEIEKLVELVKSHWNIINNKGTDTATNASKIDAWKAIERAFNHDETGGIYRPHYVLRTKFDNLKRLRKKNPVQKAPKLNEGSVGASSLTNDAEDDCFESFKSVVTVLAAKVRKSGNETFELNINDSSSETVEFNEALTGSSLRTNVSVFFPEPEQKYFVKEVDNYEDLADEKNEVEFEWRQVSFNETISQAQDSCITQSTEESLSKKRKSEETSSVSRGCNATEFNDLRKKAFLEKHHLTLRLLKEETEQRKKHESILQKLREEELRLRIQFLKDKHEAELNLMKASLTRDEET